MNVLVLERHPCYVGGSERFALDLCRHAARRGHATWLAYEREGDMLGAYAAAGTRLHAMALPPLAAREPATAWRTFRAVRAFVRTRDIDVIFSTYIGQAAIMALAARTTGRVAAVHLGLAVIPSRTLAAGLRHVTLRIAPSRHVARSWESFLPADTAPVRVIPNGVDTTLFSPGDGRTAARARLQLGDRSGPLIAFVGRLVGEKGIFTLLRAFAAHRRRGGRARLLFVGAPAGDEAARLARLAREERLDADEWRVSEPTSAVQDVYRAADLVVVPSEREEAFGLVPLEAAACGTMAIVSDGGVLPDLLGSRCTSAVFPAGDVEALAARLDYWLADDERRERAAAQLCADVVNRFSFERCGDAYLAAMAEARRA